MLLAYKTSGIWSFVGSRFNFFSSNIPLKQIILSLTISILVGACSASRTEEPGVDTPVSGDPTPAPDPGPGPAPAPVDKASPVISILSPTSGSSYSMGTANLNLTGSATDDIGVTSVQWSNDQGGSGSASLSGSSWQVSGVALKSGVNNITVTASDAVGNKNADSLAVTYTADSTPLPIGSTVVGVNVENLTNQGSVDIPITFGQVFAPGHVPGGAYLEARTTGSSPVGVPLQVDNKATHPDGSLRHAVITARVPKLGSGALGGIELVSTSAAPAATRVSDKDLLATGFDVALSVDVGGTVYEASARKLLEADASKTWLTGPLVTEWIVSAPVKTLSGVEHPHLTARFNIRAYAGFDSVRVDVILENNWAFQSNPQNFTYNLAITNGGASVYSRNSLVHYHQARWRKTFWWGKNPGVYVKHDKAYLFASGAIPNYDQSISMIEADLAAMETEWTGGRTEPMGLGLVYSNFRDTGARRDIGPLPRWTARYLLSIDKRAKTSTIGNGNQGGTFDIHYRDKKTDLPVTIDDYPYMSIKSSNTFDPARGVDDGFPACSGSCSKPYTVDSAHQPSLAYVPYLVTGDHYLMEELQFWANYNIVQANPDSRNKKKGLVKWEQVRGQAWSLRTLGHTAYITPDNHPLKNYFVEKVQFNLDYYNNKYSFNSGAPALGFITDGGAIKNEGGQGKLSPWNDDAFTMVIGFIADMGFADAIPLRDWKSKFVYGRFSEHPVFCKYHAAEYRYVVQGSYIGDGGAVINTWPELMSSSFSSCPADFDGGGGHTKSPQSYLAITHGALSAAVASGFVDAANFLNEIQQAQKNAGANFASTPQWAIVPR